MNVILTAPDGTILVGTGSVANVNGVDKLAVLTAAWTGPGSDQVFAWLNKLRQFGARDLPVSGFDDVILTGAFPPGYTVTDFAPPTAHNR